MDIFSSQVAFDVSGIARTVLNSGSNNCFQCFLFRTIKIDTMHSLN